MPEPLVIAIDGPSGVGKSTLGKALARRLGLQYIDSGAVYRAVGCKAIDSGVDPNDSEAVARLARGIDLRFEGDPDHLAVWLDGIDVTERIRRPDASHAASVVATIPEVREAVVTRLRDMARTRGVVMDGRDIGTKVFPSATVKLFIEASPQERARRRWEEERARGRSVTIEETTRELEERDCRDRDRAATPLEKAPDAILLDTSRNGIEEVLLKALDILKSRDQNISA
jgi:cytidylate kinase